MTVQEKIAILALVVAASSAAHAQAAPQQGGTKPSLSYCKRLQQQGYKISCPEDKRPGGDPKPKTYCDVRNYSPRACSKFEKDTLSCSQTDERTLRFCYVQSGAEAPSFRFRGCEHDPYTGANTPRTFNSAEAAAAASRTFDDYLKRIGAVRWRRDQRPSESGLNRGIDELIQSAVGRRGRQPGGGIDSVRVEDPDKALEFWTPERMREAVDITIITRPVK